MNRNQEENINISITIEFTLLIPDEVPNVHVSHAAESVLGFQIGISTVQTTIFFISSEFIFNSNLNKAEMTEIL